MSLEQTTRAGDQHPDLTGHVQTTDGRIVRAAVFVSNVKPKTPSYQITFGDRRDFRKSAKTNASGDFKIESLGPDLLFHLLVVGEGCKPKVVVEIDPLQGAGTIILEPLDLASLPADSILHGRIVDNTGAAIGGAGVEVSTIHLRDGGLAWGNPKEIDSRAISDGNGQFVITSRKPFVSLDLKINADGCSQRSFLEVRGGTKAQELRMTAGAGLKGRIVLEGKPVARVGVGATSTERGPGFAGHFKVETDSDGRFEFLHLPAEKSFSVYGLMSSLRTFGAMAGSLIKTGGDGSVTEMGDLPAGRAFRLAGRVVLDDSQPLPPGSELLAARDLSWDGMQIELDAQGRFDAAGIPEGAIALTVRVPGYGASERNASLDTLNPNRLAGRVDQDITDLVILMERGKEFQRNRHLGGESLAMRKRRLRGAEAGADQAGLRSAEWTISGRVTDANTGEPLAHFRVTPGNQEVMESGIGLDKRAEAQGTNGAYTVRLSKRFSDPVLKVEADGYLPVAVTPPQEDRANFDVALQPGSGPRGTVLFADGTRAVGATIALICRGDHYYIKDAVLSSREDEGHITRSDAEGRFAFAPELHMERIVAASPDGFAMVSVDELSANPNLTLQKWGGIKGVLIRPSGPGANEILDLMLASVAHNCRWSMDTGNHDTTDDNGRFDFERVPPGQLEMTYRVKMGERRWRNVSLRAPITVAPGETLELRIAAPDRETGAGFSFPQPPLPPRTGATITGRVLFATGEPARGAEVGMLVKDQTLILSRGFLRTGPDVSLKTTTGANGDFTLPGVAGIKAIIAVNEDGFARAVPEPAENGKPVRLTLQPWGKISGTLRIGERLGVNTKIVLADERFHDVHFSPDYQTKTDQQGRFVLTGVPPVELRLSWLISTGGGSWQHGPPTTVQVKPGEVTEVTIGGTGRRVFGRAIPKNPAAGADWRDVKFTLTTPQFIPPRNQKTREEVEAWYETPEGQAAYRKMRSYKTDAASDGSFCFEEVPPGEYEMTVSRERVESRVGGPGGPGHVNMCHTTMMLGGKKLTLPEFEGAYIASAFDFGTIEVDLSVEFPNPPK